MFNPVQNDSPFANPGYSCETEKPFHSPNHGISKIMVELGPKPEAHHNEHSKEQSQELFCLLKPFFSIRAQ